MPLVLKEESNVFGTTYLWRMDEDISFFRSAIDLSKEQEEQTQHWTKSRRKEWLASRFIIEKYLNHAATMVRSNQYGKPYIENSKTEISISHSGDYVAILNHVDLGVGIDIQQTSDKIARIAHKFCRVGEHELFPNHLSESDIHHYIWTAKEAIFKAYAKKELDFKKNIQLEGGTRLPHEYKCIGYVVKGTQRDQYELTLRKLGPLFITKAVVSNS